MHPLNVFQSIFCLVKAATASTFTLNPYNEYDSYYDQNVRANLGTFHINLSHGNYSANGPLVSPSIEWNVNGLLLISRSNFVSHLTAFNVTFHGLQVPDVYHVVDGHIGAVLYHLQGPQTGTFDGIAPTGNRIDVLGGELMVFDSNAELYHLISVEELARAKSQIQNLTSVPTPAANLTSLLEPNPQTPPAFRQRLRDSMGKIHANFNAGNNSANAQLVKGDVEVNADWNVTTGPQAFLDLISQWQSSFPDMVFHDDAVLADGHLGAVEFVWEGTQTGDYTLLNGTVLQPTGEMARVRGFMFFEFANDGLITKVTEVHDEEIIGPQLEGGAQYA